MPIKISKDIEVPDKVLDKSIKKEFTRFKRAVIAAEKKTQYWKDKHEDYVREHKAELRTQSNIAHKGITLARALKELIEEVEENEEGDYSLM